MPSLPPQCWLPCFYPRPDVSWLYVSKHMLGYYCTLFAPLLDLTNYIIPAYYYKLSNMKIYKEKNLFSLPLSPSSGVYPSIDFYVLGKYIYIYSTSIYLFIYLAVSGLSCGMQDLQLLHMNSSCGMEDPVPWLGIEPGPPALGAWSPSHWTIRKALGKYI